MYISIKPDIFELWPEARLGVVFAEQVNNQADVSSFKAQQMAMEEQVKKRFPAPPDVGKDPRVQAWRKAYRAFGCDPHEYRCSSEALTRQVLKGNNIWGINPLVDCYNFISLKYTVPVGGEDVDTIVGDVALKRAAGTEEFILLRGKDNEPPEIGEVVYADQKGILCRRWNWREADRTKLTPQTTTAILVIEALPPTTFEQLHQATVELAQLVERWCKAKTQQAVLSQQQPGKRF